MTLAVAGPAPLEVAPAVAALRKAGIGVEVVAEVGAVGFEVAAHAPGGRHVRERVALEHDDAWRHALALGRALARLVALSRAGAARGVRVAVRPVSSAYAVRVESGPASRPVVLAEVAPTFPEAVGRVEVMLGAVAGPRVLR